MTSQSLLSKHFFIIAFLWKQRSYLFRLLTLGHKWFMVAYFKIIIFSGFSYFSYWYLLPVYQEVNIQLFWLVGWKWCLFANGLCASPVMHKLNLHLCMETQLMFIRWICLRRIYGGGVVPQVNTCDAWKQFSDMSVLQLTSNDFNNYTLWFNRMWKVMQSEI